MTPTAFFATPRRRQAFDRFFPKEDMRVSYDTLLKAMTKLLMEDAEAVAVRVCRPPLTLSSSPPPLLLGSRPCDRVSSR